MLFDDCVTTLEAFGRQLFEDTLRGDLGILFEKLGHVALVGVELGGPRGMFGLLGERVMRGRARLVVLTDDFSDRVSANTELPSNASPTHSPVA